MIKKIALLVTLLMAAMPLHAQERSDYIRTTCRRVGVMAMYFVKGRDRGISHKDVIDLLKSPAAPPEPPWAKGLLEGVADGIWAQPEMSPSDALTMGYLTCIEFMKQMEKASDQRARPE